MKTKREIIEETVAYYSEDVTRRALSYREGGSIAGCKYLTSENKMCAVGRCLTEEGLKEWGDYSSYFTLDMIDSLKEEYKVDDYGFWSDLQKLHDTNSNWDENGLSEDGKSFVNWLLETYA